LDGTDLRILSLLQENSERSISEISDAIHLSQNACWRRIRQLEEGGYILKRVALLDAVKLGAGMTVFVMVRAGEHSQEWLERFADAVRKIPEIVEFYRMSGEVDYLIKIRVADIAGYDRVYKQLIRSAPLTDVSGAFAMEELKHTTAIPLPAH
jgi:Lrp/AsnC family transcriptional regulator, cysteine-sensing transcriptional activator